MLRLELIFLYFTSGDGCFRRRREGGKARNSQRNKVLQQRRNHSELSANLLIYIELNSTDFSECALISLKVLPDFDSARTSPAP